MGSEWDVMQEQIRPGLTLLRLQGELDIATSPRLKEMLLAAVDAGAVGLVVDLADVTFVDSSGFTALLSAVKRLARHNGRLALVSTDPSVARALRMMSLTDVMPAFATREAAIASLDALRR